MLSLQKGKRKKQDVTGTFWIASVALVLAFVIFSTSSFQNSFFKSLFPKPPSHAAGIITPTKLIVTYQPPVYIGGVSLTATEINQKFQAIESTPDDDHWSGFSGPFLYYALFDQTEGPPGLDTITAQTQTCATLGKDSYISAAENSVTTYFHGEFCQIHDSIVNKTGFDHDLNPNTPQVVATEDWFLHDSTGKRITFNQGSTVYYAVNPANQNWREYFIARLFRDLNFQPGQSINELHWLSRIKATGIFLDNVGLGWATFRNNSNNKTNPVDFSSSSAFSDAVFQFVQQIHSALHDSSKNYNYPIWANMIAGSDTGSDWDRYIPYLEGGMKEDFVLNWGSGPYSSTTILNQITQMEKWVANGKVYHGAAWARYSDPTNLGIDFHFSLAAFLLATDGNNGYYKLRGSSYKYFYDYPEYYYQLGSPITSLNSPTGAKYQKPVTPLTYRRDFQCGFVELDLTNIVGTISYTSGCVPGTNPTFTSSPTPSLTPTPLNVTNTPIPTSVPTQLTISGVQTSNITISSTTIRWNTSYLGTSWVEYGTSSFSLTNRTMIDSSLVTSHSVAISGLTKNTRYYYKVHSADSSGIDYASSLYNFKTKNR